VALSYVSEKLRGDLSFWRTVIRELPEDGWHLAFVQYGPLDLLGADKKTMLEAVKRNVEALSYGSDVVRGDPEVVMEALKRDWKGAKYCSRLEVNSISKAIAQDWRAISSYLDLLEPWKIEGMAKLVKINPQIVRDPRLGKVHEVMTLAVKQNGLLLACGTKELRDDRDLVDAAISQTWRALGFASKRLRNDMALITKALKQDGLALQHASDEIRDNASMVIDAMKRNPAAFRFAGTCLHADNSFWEVLVRTFYDTAWIKWLQHGRGQLSPGFSLPEEGAPLKAKASPLEHHKHR
ncbi:unnamed protein product, partial [Polarella glacialis]